MTKGIDGPPRSVPEKLAARVDGERLLEELDLEDEEIEWRKEFVGFDDGDVRRLERMQEALDDIKDEAVEEFYQHLQRYEETQAVLDRSTRTVGQLKDSQAAYLVTLGNGTYDRSYFQDRARIGKIHDMLEMPMKQYIGTYMLYYNILIPRLADRVIERTTADLDGGEEIVELEFREGIEEIMSLYGSRIWTCRSPRTRTSTHTTEN